MSWKFSLQHAKNQWWSNCLINTIADGKKLSFSESNIYCMMNYFDGRFIVYVDVWDGHGNMIFDAHIWYDNGQGEIGRSFENNVIKIFNMNLDTFLPQIKENILEKELMRQFSGENSWLNGSKEGRNSFFLLFMLMRRLLKWSLYLDVRVLRDRL